LTSRKQPLHDLSESAVSRSSASPGGAGAASQAAVFGQTAPQGAPEQGHSYTRPASEIITVRRVTVADRFPICDHNGKEILRVTETQAAKLIERRLIGFCGRSNRPIHQFRLKPGVAVASVRAVLREHVSERLPIAEDNRTIQRVLEGGVHYEHIHEREWDDGRETATERGQREYDAMWKAGLL